jgi:hypothetical protein
LDVVGLAPDALGVAVALHEASSMPTDKGISTRVYIRPPTDDMELADVYHKSTMELRRSKSNLTVTDL